MKLRKFIRSNTEKTELMNEISHLKYKITSQERVIKRLFDRRHKPFNPDLHMICHSYESGFGHGLNNDGFDLSKTPHAEETLGQAYQIGYEEGQKRYRENINDGAVG